MAAAAFDAHSLLLTMLRISDQLVVHPQVLQYEAALVAQLQAIFHSIGSGKRILTVRQVTFAASQVVAVRSFCSIT